LRILATLAFFDAAHFADRVPCPALVGVPPHFGGRPSGGKMAW
jgi:hypothetical protein